MEENKKIVFSALKPTGDLQIGNYIGALKNMVEMANQYDCYYAVADLHSLTVDNLPADLRRRTEIARCLAIEPKFVMLDESFAGVDPIAVQEIQDVVWRLKDKNIGILITDHNVDETLMITDRAYLLFEGKILFHGTPEELAANPVVRKNYLGRDFELKKKTRVEE